MWSWLFEPFWEFPFMAQALLASVLLGLNFSIIGLVLVARRLALIGDTLSHALLPGVVLGYLWFGGEVAALFWSGLLTGILLFLASQLFARRKTWEMDSSLAVFAVFAMALGILIASKFRTSTEILHLLFGNLLAIETSLVQGALVVGGLTWLLFLIFRRHLLMALVDPQFFNSMGHFTSSRRLILTLLLAANLTLGFAALGAMMTVGLLIVPTLLGRLWGKTLLSQVFISSGAAALFSWVGLLLSFHFDLPAAPAIVVVACGCLFVGVMLSGWRRPPTPVGLETPP